MDVVVAGPKEGEPEFAKSPEKINKWEGVYSSLYDVCEGRTNNNK